MIFLDNKFLKEDYFADKEMPRLVEKLISNLLQSVKTRKKQLKNQFWDDHEPRIILIRPLPRPAYSLLDPKKVKILRRLCSNEVEKVALHHRVTFLNIDELNCSQRVLFDDYGNLSQYGIEKFWHSISEYLRRFDRDEYYAVKKFRTPTRTIGTQTFTQQTTINQPQTGQTYPTGSQLNRQYQQQAQPNVHVWHQGQHHASDVQNQSGHAYHNQQQPPPYNYKYGVNDQYHVNHLN